MRLMGLVCGGAIAVGLLAGPAVLAAQRETETVNRTVPLPDKGTLQLHNFKGPVKITGTSGRDVVIKAIRRADRERLDRIKLDITTTGSTVSIDANKRDSDSNRDRRDRDNNDNNVVETEFDIQVPASAELDIDVFESDVTIAGVTGEQRLKTFSGRVVVTGARGPIEANSFSGGLEIDLTAAGGTPDLSVETFSGSIRLRLADAAKGSVRFTTFSGNFDSDIPLTMRSSGGGRNNNRVSGDLPGGSGGATLRFHTFSGDVRVTK
jgi:DUF4097 and DUF4098 domain-containing protein YvlB